MGKKKRELLFGRWRVRCRLYVCVHKIHVNNWKPISPWQDEYCFKITLKQLVNLHTSVRCKTVVTRRCFMWQWELSNLCGFCFVIRLHFTDSHRPPPCYILVGNSSMSAPAGSAGEHPASSFACVQMDRQVHILKVWPGLPKALTPYSPSPLFGKVHLNYIVKYISLLISICDNCICGYCYHLK